MPIRTRIVLLVMGVMLPVAMLLAAVLANDFRRAELAGGEKVGILATGTAADLKRMLDQFEWVLARVSERPLVKALDPAGCDPLVEEVLNLNPAIAGVAVLDAQGRVICRSTSAADAVPMPDDMSAGPPELPVGRLRATRVFVGEHTGRKLVALSYALGEDDRARGGLLVMTADLLVLNAQLLASIPKDAIVTVVDGTGIVLLRSADPERFVGHRPAMQDTAPARGASKNPLSAVGRDGIKRLYTYVTLPGSDWRVAAGLVDAEVFAEYRGAIWRIGGFATVLCIFAFGLAWRLSAAVAAPIADLQRVASKIADGNDADARVGGPPEIKAVAEQFNRMLIARNQSDARLQGIMESVVDAVLTTNEQQIIVQANPAAASMFRCAMWYMVGAPLERFIPERYRPLYRRDIERFGSRPVAPHRLGLRREVTALRADGTEFPVEASLSKVSIAGVPLNTVILRDITERKRVEQELRDGASKLEAALSSMSDAVCIADVHGKLIDFNLAFATFHGFADEAACRTTLSEYPEFLDMVMPDGRAAEAAQWPLSRALQGETASNCEFRLRRKDSGKTWIGSYSFAPIRSGSGTIVGAVIAARDVTAIRAVQADLESSHFALQRLIASRDQVQEEERKRIARELHDDLQQTLAAIRMNLRYIGEHFGTVAPGLLVPIDEVDGLAAQAVVSTRRIVNDLRPPMLEDLGLLPALELLASQFGQQTGIVCRIDAPPGIYEAPTEDPELAICLYRVVQEALNNVVKHAHASTVRIRLVMESAVAISLQVTDDGVGMDEADLHKSESFGILGIQERVRSHGGLMRIESTPGAGTRLEVHFPLGARPPVVARHARAARSGDSAREDTDHEALDDAHTLPRLLSRTTQRALQDAIDALTGNVAILDAHGVIRFVNRAWNEFARRNGVPDTASVGHGVDYIEACRKSRMANVEAPDVARGLKELLNGNRTAFSSTYACHSPDELRWFQMNATPMANGNVLVEHVLIRHESRGHRGSRGAA
ncbi:MULTISPECIES: PAS domain S-box protein [unclassified Variovorax]|uniref:PAS domain S-box protein n=1 Tax=unclassified Variovorax TaxID=663243 RepID=UPI001BD5D529|nr:MULTISPECIES: PAS domain S-box protein [unclassified Variovorax]